DRIEKLKADVLFEITLVEEAVNRLNEIKARLPIVEDDHITEPAMGTYLMNFYNGVENVVKRACKLYYDRFPKGDTWHKELLRLSCKPPEGKEAIFSEDIVKSLNKYLNFRHRFISGYGFQLKVEKMLELVNDVEILWDDIQKDLNSFLEKLS
ncbi:MAG: hypothetical protein KAR31_10885, partial [Candidatus Omnitrophica bacterium]|nr:hypothetical protein [Candidatus Omnitrophota bacterium]